MNLVWGILVLLVVVALAIGAMLLVRRGAPEGSYFSDGDRASGVFGVLATGFAIFAGFVIYLAFTSYDQSRVGAETEALTVAQQVETAQFLPAALSARLTGELVCYGRSVVGQEWPAMENGTIGETINPWGVALFRSIRLSEPRTGSEQSAHDKFLDQTTEREQARSDRIHGASGIVPGSLWIVLLLTAGVLFAYMLFFADSAERARSQAMLMGSAGTIVVVTLLAIYTLDNPYAPGVGRLEPAAMERSLVLLDQVRATLGDDAPLPCDADGRRIP
jgi:hypothetical protein